MSFLTRGMTLEPPHQTWTLFILKPGWRRRLNGYVWLMYDHEVVTGMGVSREELRETLLAITAKPAFEPYHPDDQRQARVMAREIMNL